MTSVEVDNCVNFDSRNSGFTKQVDGGNVNLEASNVQDSSENLFEFWAKQLTGFLDPKSVVFAAFENGKFTKIHLIEVVQKLKEVDYFEDVMAINLLPQPNFVKVTFSTVSMADIFIDTVTHINNNTIKVVDKSMQQQSVIISISNLPPDLISKFVIPQLAPFGSCIRFLQQHIPKKSGGNVQIGVTRLDFKLLDGITTANIPYFIRVLGFKVYLNIRDRPRICFRCNNISHLVSACPFRYCGACRSLKLVSHICSVSYASAVSSVTKVDLVPMMHDSLHVDNHLLSVKDTNVDVHLESDSVDSQNPESEGSVVSNEEMLSDKIQSPSDQESPDTGKQILLLKNKRMRTRSVTRAAEKTSLSRSKTNYRSENSGKSGQPVRKKKKKNKSRQLEKALPVDNLSQVGSSGQSSSGIVAVDGGLKELPPEALSPILDVGSTISQLVVEPCNTGASLSHNVLLSLNVNAPCKGKEEEKIRLA